MGRFTEQPLLGELVQGEQPGRDNGIEPDGTVHADRMLRLSLYLPTGWVMDALHRLMNFGDPAAAALPHFLGLALLALALGWVAARHFRFQ